MRLDLVVGPNDAGKSTFVELVIAALRWLGDPQTHSYEAAIVTARTRDRLLERREPVIAETVFSHPSKLDLVEAAMDAGYTVAVHVVLVPEELSVQRVAHRVANGGHLVPEDKVRQRYHRLWPLVVEAIERVDAAGVWDNSRHAGPVQVSRFVHGIPVGRCSWPGWAPEVLSRRWPE